MRISEDMQRVIKQRSQRDSLYSSVYKNISIVSCNMKQNTSFMILKLPIIDQWVNHEGFVTNAAMGHIIDTLPGIFVMAIGSRSSVAVNLKINFIGKAKVGDVLTIQLEHEFSEKGEFGNIEIEVKNQEELIAKGNITSKFIKLLWAKEKI